MSSKQDPGPEGPGEKPPATGNWSQQDMDKLLSLRSKKLSYVEIAFRLGRTLSSVSAKIYETEKRGPRRRRPKLSTYLLEAPEPDKTVVQRKCLRCQKLFKSKDAVRNRICDDCKSSTDWR
jgi:hypothetical protein